MLPLIVVVIEPVRHVFGKLCASVICLQVNSFIFQGAPESLNENIISETPFAVHADFDVPGLEY